MLTRDEFLASPHQKVVVFHKDCTDGFAAAWVASKALGHTDVTYLAAAYGTTLQGLPPGSAPF